MSAKMAFFVIIGITFSGCIEKKKRNLKAPSVTTGADEGEESGSGSGGDDAFSKLLDFLTNGGGADGGTVTEDPLQGPGGDPSAVSYYMSTADGGQSLSAFATYVSPYMNEFTKPVDFSCPGDSFLTGEFSEADSGLYAGNIKPTFDRRFIYTCSFFEDGNGRPLRKVNCTTTAAVKGDQEIQLSSGCGDNSYVAGVKSMFRPEKRDREFAYTCCQMVSSEDKPVVTLKTPIGTSNKDPQENCSYGITSEVARSGALLSAADAPGPIPAGQGESVNLQFCANEQVNASGEFVQFDGMQAFFFDRNACLAHQSGNQGFIPNQGSTCQKFFSMYFTVIQKESTVYTGADDLSDRSYSFKSCALSVNTGT